MILKSLQRDYETRILLEGGVVKSVSDWTMEMIKRGYGLPPLSSAKNEYKKEKKINIIDAKTARKLTETSLSSEALYELEKVNKCIQDAINEGKYNCYYYHYLHDPAVRKLKDIGYKVTNCSTQREGDCFKIEW